MEKMIYPISTSSFPIIREKGWFYVDKTAYVYRLSAEGQYYFLSRPRRFGKSLLISTLQSYFLGQKELFAGLEIEKLEKDWLCYEVLRLDLSAGDMTSYSGLYARLEADLKAWEDIYGSNDAEKDHPTRFQGVIRRAAQKRGRGVVVLIDEYDNPLFSSIDNQQEYEKIQATLKSMYSILKSESDNIRLCLLTGITRFSRMSVFSGLNNLHDITLSPKYSGICGITQSELIGQCTVGINGLAMATGMPFEQALSRLKAMYDGYHFGDLNTDIYNPYSLMNAFSEGEIKDYWFGSGTSQFLWKRIVSHTDRRSLERILSPALLSSELGTSESEGMSLSGLLFQTGYLTIKDYDPESRIYKLGLPNIEVRNGLLNKLLPLTSYQDTETARDDLYILRKYANAGEVDKMMEYLRSFLAGISYRLTGREPEIFYENNLYLIFSLIGMDTKVEVDSSSGRMDVVMRCGDFLYIIELKRDFSAEKALNQIIEKEYPLQFEKERIKNPALKVIAVGINFSSKERNISSWETQTLSFLIH